VGVYLARVNDWVCRAHLELEVLVVVSVEEGASDAKRTLLRPRHYPTVLAAALFCHWLVQVLIATNC
jgi:hypothetical protein